MQKNIIFWRKSQKFNTNTRDMSLLCLKSRLNKFLDCFGFSPKITKKKSYKKDKKKSRRTKVLRRYNKVI